MTAFLMLLGALTYQPAPPTAGEIAEAAALLEGVATATVGATRTGNSVQEAETLPPPPVVYTGLNGWGFAPDGLSNCDEMNFYRAQVGLPSAFAGIGWRESNCRNEDGVHTSCCYGYWQMSKIHFNGTGYVHGRWCDARTVFDVASDNPYDKQRQACAAKALFDADGWSPWSATS